MLEWPCFWQFRDTHQRVKKQRQQPFCRRRGLCFTAARKCSTATGHHTCAAIVAAAGHVRIVCIVPLSTNACKSVKAQHADICEALIQLGEVAAWSKLGKKSEYYRPHVQRRLWFLLGAMAKVPETKHLWQKWKINEAQRNFPDVKSVLQAVPEQWKYGCMVRFVRMSKHVPFQHALLLDMLVWLHHKR